MSERMNGDFATNFSHWTMLQVKQLVPCPLACLVRWLATPISAQFVRLYLKSGNHSMCHVKWPPDFAGDGPTRKR